MKTTISRISFIFLLLSLMSVGCEEKDQIVSPSYIGDIVSVFELKYDHSKEITYGGEKIEFLVKNVIDSVSIDCSLADFADNQKGTLDIRIYAYLQVNGQNETVKVESKPCGALLYANDDQDVQDVVGLINDLQSAPANSESSSYFTNAFVDLFGEGFLIENTSFRIFIAKAFPTKYIQPNANKEDYKFIFILTSNP